MKRGLFITGTDTGVGKTRVGTALARVLHRDGFIVRVRKPVESGCAEGAHGRIAADAEALRLAAGAIEPPERVCALRLRAALSPARAAALEGIDLDLDPLHRACLAGIDADDVLLVEGAGGFYSPIAQGALNADLAAALALPVLLVASDRLGAINHTLMTAEAARRRGLVVAGLVLNAAQPIDDPALDNAAELAEWLDAPVLRLPHGGTPADEDAALAAWTAPWREAWRRAAAPA